MLSDLRYRLRALFARHAVEQELDDELRYHIERETEKYILQGMPADEAFRRARVAFGGVQQYREESRDARGTSALEAVGADLRYAVRRLIGAPGFAAAAIVTLALGIGGSTAIFSAVYPVLLEPLPYPGSGRIAMMSETAPDGSRVDGSFGMYRALVERTRTFEAMAVMRPWYPVVSGTGRPERVEGQRVSAAWFSVVGIAPALGRAFQAADDAPGAPRVVVLGHRLWRNRFGADSSIIGTSVDLDGIAYTIVGVMPGDFENIMAPSAGIWAPLQYGMSQGRAWGHHLRTTGRLRPGVTLDDASRELTAIGQALIDEQRPPTYGDSVRIAVTSLREDATRAVKPALLAVAGAMLLVLVIACVNVTNLLLARGVQRRGEFALRAVLGASRRRIAAQLLTESLVLAFAGGLAALGVAYAGVRGIVTLSPPELPRLAAIGVQPAAFAFALLVTTLVGVGFGLLPALQAARADQGDDVRRSSNRVIGGHRRVRGALVVAEVALALVLLVSSGLLLRSMSRLFAVDAGFDADRVLSLQVQVAGPRYTADSTVDLFYARSLEAVRRVPGVTGAAFTSQLPLSGDRDEYGVQFEGSTAGFSTFRYSASPGFIETMGIPLRRGRLLGEDDRAGAPLAALINESFARRVFPDGDAIGRRLTVGPLGPYTVVGIVGDVRQMSLALSEPDAVYITPEQWGFADNAMSLVVRGRTADAALIAAVREAVWSVDRDQAIVRVASLRDLVRESAAERRFALLLFEAFAVAALLLAAAGLYGVLAGRVAERRNEIGVRAALGASRATIVGEIVRHGLRLTGLGIAIGIAGAYAAARGMTAMLFGITPLDTVTWVGVIALLGLVSLAAASLPAWRAARVDPMTALRMD